MKGKLVAVEGIDSSGKSLQSELLEKRLRRAGFKCKHIHFPRYETFFGKIIKKYLKGGFGSKESLPAEFSALLYAIDRFNARNEIESLLKKGFIVIANRYTASNIAHQSALLKTQKRRKQLMEWIRQVESRLPAPDLTILLDMPLPAVQILMKKRGRKKDVYEKDAAYLKRVRGIFLQLSKQKDWCTIKCASFQQKEWKILPVEEVHEAIWKRVKRLF